MMIPFDKIDGFRKELSRLLRKYRSLDEDLETFKKVVEVKIQDGSILKPAKHWAILTSDEKVVIIKTRLACKYLRGESMRIVFAYHPIEGRSCFIELYYKGEKKNEDRKLYEKYVSEL